MLFSVCLFLSKAVFRGASPGVVGRVSVIFHVRLTVHSSNLGHWATDKGKTLRPKDIFKDV